MSNKTTGFLFLALTAIGVSLATLTPSQILIDKLLMFVSGLTFAAAKDYLI
jgi:hypothetical protein